jgi:4-hydroxybenzoate polyprenyltransferase/phosphoserine phosphatase
VLCVDLDGTLIAGDLLWESFVELVKRRPFRALIALTMLWRGKAQFKRQIALHADFDASTLPYRAEVIKELTELRVRGSVLVLATASDEAQARAVAKHLGLFSDVVASDGRTNMSGSRKAAALVERYGEGGFGYYGNDWADVPVWRVAAEATAVAASPRLVRHVRGLRTIREIGGRPALLASVAKALRPHQWVKNLLVFVPLIAAHKVLQIDAWVSSALTFVVFSLCASGIYLLNDIVDIQADRVHPRKRKRPFAAGDLSVPFGVLLAGLLVGVALTLGAWAVSLELAFIASVYLVTTSLYSLGLKRQPVADVFTLTGLYVLRIVAGGVATATTLSSWLLAFALFFFLSLAFVKRYTEVVTTEGELAGRGYGPQDALWMHAVGTSSGYMAVVVLALYVNAPDVTAIYTRPQSLGILCPLLLFWITRLWFRAGRKMLHDDPVVEALKDPASYATAAVGVAVLSYAI